MLAVLFVFYVVACALAFLTARNAVESGVRAALLDKPPHSVFTTNLATPYLVPTVVFALLAYMEQLQRASVRTVEEREQDQIRITVDVTSDEQELNVGGL